MDEVFKALADPSRRRLLDSLNAHNGQTLRELCAGLEMARQSVSKHLALLEAANVVTTVWRGREKLHYLNAAPIIAIADRWIDQYVRGRVEVLADLTRALESESMDKPEFVYTTYINTTAEKLWEALTDPAFTSRYWGATFESEWTPGATMSWTEGGLKTVDPAQVVLEAEPHHRLSYTWHTFTPEFGEVHGMNAEVIAAMAEEPRSKVTFDIAPHGKMIKLTVTHDGFGPDSTVLAGITEGWPEILSSLKSLLETGKPL